MTMTHFQTEYKSKHDTFTQHMKFMTEYLECRNTTNLSSSLSDGALEMFMTASSIIMGDILTCYYTLRIDRLFDRLQWPDPIDFMLDLPLSLCYNNLRLAMRCIFLIRSEIINEYLRRFPGNASILIDGFDDCYKSKDDNEWYYRHYSSWCVHLIVNHGIPFDYLLFQTYSWNMFDIKCMCECWRGLQYILQGMGTTDADIMHLVRPYSLPERMYPTVRYLVDLEYRMIRNTRSGASGIPIHFRERSESVLEETVHEPKVKRVQIDNV